LATKPPIIGGIKLDVLMATYGIGKGVECGLIKVDEMEICWR
jgi:hypothetical protein